MSNVIPFPTPEMVVIEEVMCSDVDEPPSALRRRYWITYYDETGGRSIERDGATYLAALEAAMDWDLSGVRVVDRVRCPCGGA